MTTTDHDLANAQTHINLLEAQVADLQAEIAEWDERYTGEGRARFECAEHVERLQAQLTAHADVISAARHATAWWFNDVYERYPTLQAPWVGPLNLALRRLDQGKP